MAKTISDEKLKLQVIIDSNPAQQELHKLEKSTRALTHENKALLLQKKLLEKQGKQDSEQYKELSKTIKANSKEIRTNKERMNELQKEIGITSLTMGQLISRANVLKLSLKHTIPGSEAHSRYKRELAEISARMDVLSGKAQKAKLSIGSIADGFNRYAAIGASILAFFSGVVLSVQKIIDINGKLSDSQAKVQKTTGMTKEEVDELTKSFGIFKTRTSREDLLGIAEIGGRLGIAKNEIGDFVQVMNKANVALGDSFEGGPEVVAEKLGRIKGLYDEIKDLSVESAFESVGSAMNELGADGTASEENIANFVTRVGALPEALKPSISEALGLGAAFEESGLKAELAGTNYGKVISIAARDFPQFAKVMGMTQGKVKDLLNTNPTEFFLQFANSLKGMDATQLSSVLDYLKLNDNEVKMVLGAASKNTDIFREKIELAAVSMAEATSLTNEYNIQNNSLGATLEKIKKTVMGWFSSESFVKWLTSSFEWLGKFIGATEDADGSVVGFRNNLIFFLKVLTIVITSYLSYQTALKLTVIWSNTLKIATTLLNIVQARGTAISGLLKSAQLLLSSAYYLLTGNVTRASAAMRLFNMTAKANPIGILIALMASLAVAFFVFRKNSVDVSKSLNTISSETQVLARRNAEMQSSFAESSSQLRSKIEPLIRILKDNNSHLETRKLAYQELIKLNPEFIDTVDKEFMATSKLDAVYASILDKLKQKLRAQANEKVMSEFYENEAKAVSELVKLERELENIRQKRMEYDAKAEGMTGEARQKQLEKGVAYEIEWNRRYAVLLLARKKMEETSSDRKFAEDWRTNEIKRLEDALKGFKEGTQEYIDTKNELLSLLGKVDDPTAPTKNNFTVPEKEDKKKKGKSESEKRLEELKKMAEERLRIIREAEDAVLNNMDSGYEKEYKIEQINNQRRIEDLKARLVANADIELAIKKANNKALSAEERNFWFQKAEDWSSNNQHINSLIESNDIAHNLKLAAIQEKGASDRLKKEDEKYNEDKLLRETKFNEELANLGSDEKAREALTKKFAEEELKNEEEYLRVLIDKLNSIASKEAFSGIDLSLLTPEQVEDFTKQAQKVGLTLSELIAKKNELSGKSSTKENKNELGLGGNTDILGFTPENWQQFYSNLQQGKLGIEEMIFSVQALSNLWGKYSEYVTANENAQLKKFERSSDAKKTRLKRQLDAGYISQNQYSKAIEIIDKDLDLKKANLEYKQAKRQRTMNIANAISGTALAVINALQTKPFLPMGPIMAGVAGAMGALQIGTILKTPLPTRGYEDGLYGDYVDVQREQDGKKFRPKYAGKLKSGLVSQNSLMVAEGNKPEMIIDNKAWKKISPEVKDALLREIRGVKGFENGYYKDGQLYSGSTSTGPNNPDDEIESGEFKKMFQLMMVMVGENTEAIRELRKFPLTANVDPYNYRNMKNLQEGLTNYDDIKSKQKK